MKNLLFVLLAFTASLSYAQAPAIEWEAFLPGNCSYIVGGRQTADGGYIAFSGDNSCGSDDSDVFKLDAEGNIVWTTNFGNAGESYNETHVVRQTPDGGYIVAGGVSADWENIYHWAAKLDADGHVEWEQLYDDGNSATWNRIIDILPTPDGGYIATGIVENLDTGVKDIQVLKLDGEGNIEWTKEYGGSGEEESTGIQLTADGGYIISGWTESNDGTVSNFLGVRDVWIIKLLGDGSLEWEKTLGGSGYDMASSILPTADGNYILGAESTSTDGEVTGNHGGDDLWVVKINPSGDILWEKSYGGTGHEWTLSGVASVSDGGYIIGATTTSSDGDVEGGGLGNLDAWVLKIDSVGNIKWQQVLGDEEYQNGVHIEQTADGGFFFVGYNTKNEESNVWAVKFSAEKLSTVPTGNDLERHVTIFPSPASETASFSEPLKNISVFSSDGRMMLQHAEATKTLDISYLPDGIYFIKAENLDRLPVNLRFVRK